MGIYTKEQLLAWDLSKELDDKKSFGLYVKLAKKYPEFFLRSVLAKVKEVKNWDLVKNKGNYFVKSFYNIHKKL
jgi:hypothetical protein